MNFLEVAALETKALNFVEQENYKFTKDEVADLLRVVSDYVTSSLSKNQMEAPQVRQIISLGTTAYLGEGEEAETATKCLKFLKVLFQQFDSTQILYLFNCTVDVFYAKTNAQTLHLLPQNFKKTLQDFIDKMDVPSCFSQLQIKQGVWKNLQKLRDNPGLSVSLLKSINGLINHAKANDEHSRIAMKALTYLALEEDLISDTLGIFGLADDIYVIEKFASDIGILNFGDSFLVDLRTHSSNAERFYFEHENQLYSLGPQLKTILKSISHLKTQEKNKICVALPEVGPTALLQLVNSHLSQTSNIGEDENVMPAVGEELFFKVVGGYVAAIFDGFREYQNNKIPMLRFVKDSRTSSLSVSENIIKSAIRSVPAGAKVYRNQHDFVSRQADEIPIMPRHIILDNTSKHGYLVYSQKKHFLEQFNATRPFGLNFNEICNLSYIKASGSIEKWGSGPIDVLLTSNETVAKELIEQHIKSDQPLELIIEHSNQCSGLISLLSDWHLEKIKGITCVLTTSDTNTIEELEDRGFQLLFLNDAFADQKKQKSGLISPLRQYEHFLTDTSKGPKIRSNEVYLPNVDDFHYIVKEIFSEAEDTDLNFRYLVTQFREFLIWDPLPISNTKLEIGETYREKLIDELRFNRSSGTELLREFLENKWNELIEEVESRDLINALRNVETNRVGVFARSIVEQKKLLRFLEKFGMTSIQVCLPNFDSFLQNVETILVPVVPSKYKRIKLTNSKMSENIILNFSMYETEIFGKTQAWQKAKNRKLFDRSAEAFKRFSSVSSKRKSNLDKSNLDKPPSKDLVQDLEISDFEIEKIKRAHGSNKGEGVTDAVPLLLENNEFILIPSNAKSLRYDHISKSFDFWSPTKLHEGDWILIKADSNSDFIDVLCVSIDHDFEKTLKEAKLWKKQLANFQKAYSYTGSALTRKLSDQAQVTKSATTIRNWLFNSSIIGPDDHGVILKKLNEYLKPFGYGFDPTKVSAAIEFVYQRRRLARDQLADYFTGETFGNVETQSQISVNLNGASINFDVKEIVGISEVFEVPYASVWTVSKL